MDPRAFSEKSPFGKKVGLGYKEQSTVDSFNTAAQGEGLPDEIVATAAPLKRAEELISL